VLTPNARAYGFRGTAQQPGELLGRAGMAATCRCNPTGGTIAVMVAEYAKVSVTLPAGLLERIRGRVGARGLSGYVAEALEAEERRSALRAWLAAQDSEYGPVPASVIEEVSNEWLGAGSGDS
jgi:hypothetical protein